MTLDVRHLGGAQLGDTDGGHLVAESMQRVQNIFPHISGMSVGMAGRLSSAGGFYMWPFQHGALKWSNLLHGSSELPEGVPRECSSIRAEIAQPL